MDNRRRMMWKKPQLNVIYYTSTDGKIVKPSTSASWGGATIVSNTYSNGQGIIAFNRKVTTLTKSFNYCSTLQSIILPETVTSIGTNAFTNTALTEIIIPNSVTEIGDYAFSQCTSLTNVIMPDSVTSIGYRAFYYCSSLLSINLSNNLINIGSEVFNKCTSLPITNNARYADTYLVCASSTSITSCTILPNTRYIGYQAFYNCSKLTNISIPSSVIFLDSWSFAQCGIKSITIPNGVSKILASTFQSTSLTSVTIPDSVTSIGSRAFYSNALTSVTIPENVTSIEGNAFYYSRSLKTLYCRPINPPTLSNNTVFYSYPSDFTIYVPSGSVDAYKSAQYWSDFADRIVGYEF